MGKKILESEVQLIEGDSLILVSDGAIHAGVGGVLNLGWKWENVAEYLIKQSKKRKMCQNNFQKTNRYIQTFFITSNQEMIHQLLSLRCGSRKSCRFFPVHQKNKNDDSRVVQKFMQSKGKKIVCGGTAANIISRETGKKNKSRY